jgi:hypothetical protein
MRTAEGVTASSAAMSFAAWLRIAVYQNISGSFLELVANLIDSAVNEGVVGDSLSPSSGNQSGISCNWR